MARKKSTRLKEETPNLPNDHVIQDLIASYRYSNAEVEQALLRREQNVDCILDGIVIDPDTGKKLSRKEAIERFDLEEPSDAQRVENCKSRIRSSSNQSAAQKTWGSFFRGEKMIQSKLPEYFELCNKRLNEQIRRGRNQEQERRKRAEKNESLSTGEGGLVHNIAGCQIERLSTGVKIFDHLFGANRGQTQEGIPVGTTTLLGGEPGVGKTRFLIYMAALMSRPVENGGQNHRVLYQQGETDHSFFAQNYVKPVLAGSEDLYIHGDRSLAANLDRMYQLQPKLVIVDSIQMIDETSNHRGALRTIKRMGDVAAEMGASVIFISHLNAQGGIKGGTNLPHMVDIVMIARKLLDKHQFMISCPEKNRFGPTGRNAAFEHGESKVMPINPDEKVRTGKRVLTTLTRPNIDAVRRPAEIVVPRPSGGQAN